MYLNNSIFGGGGGEGGVQHGFSSPCDGLYRYAPPISGTFSPGGRGGVLPCMAYMGMCRWTGYGFLKHLKCQQNHSNKPMSVE